MKKKSTKRKEKRQLSPLEQKLNNFVIDHLAGIPFIQKIFFIDHLRTMIHAGLSIVEALDILAKQMENKKLQNIIKKVKAEVEKGNPLSEVLSKYPKAFPNLYVSMIEAGETAGKLEESLEQIVIQMQKSYDLRSSIRSAMIYPSVVLVAMGGIGVMMVTFVIPKLLIIFEDFDTELPLATRALIVFTNIVTNPIYASISITIIVSSIISFVTLLKKSPAFKRTIHKTTLKLPIFGKVIKKINLAQFSLTLSSMLKSTIPIIRAVEITGNTCSNATYRDSLKSSVEHIKSGTPLSEILRKDDNLFPPMVTEMIMVGERSGEVEQLLSELSNFYAKEVDKTMKNFTTIIEPVIILALGLAVAGMAVAVIMPMYNLVQNF